MFKKAATIYMWICTAYVTLSIPVLGNPPITWLTTISRKILNVVFG